MQPFETLLSALAEALIFSYFLDRVDDI